MEHKEGLNLEGFLTVRDDSGKILISQKNLITNQGVKYLTQGYGIKNYIKYLGVGRENRAAARSDTFLVSEFARYNIDEVNISNGLAIINVAIDDHLTSHIKEWGLFMNIGTTNCSKINTGILFSRVVADLQRFYKQKLMIEWRISLT